MASNCWNKTTEQVPQSTMPEDLCSCPWTCRFGGHLEALGCKVEIELHLVKSRCQIQPEQNLENSCSAPMAFLSSKAADHVNSSHIFSTVICISPALRNSSRPWSSWPWWNKRTWRSEMTDLPSFELYTAVAIALIPLASSQVDQEASAVGLFCNFFCKSLAKRTRLNTLIGTSAPFVSCTVLANIQAQALVGPFLPLLHFLTYMLSAATKPLRCLSAKGADVLITIHRLPERMLKAASFPMPMSFSISYSASRTAARSLSEKSAASASGIRKWVWWTSGSCEHPSTSDDCSLDSSTSPGNKTEMLDTKRPRNFLTHLTRAHIAGLWRSRSPPLETFLKAE